MRELRHLTVEAIEAIHDRVLAAHGGLPGLRDRALLESAVAAPQASFAGQLLLKDSIEIAAAYLFYLARNHPFADGNKRTALAASLVFLEANGLLSDPGLPGREVDEWEHLVVDIGASRMDREQTTRRLRQLLTKASKKNERKTR
jgi:death on curing protein